MNDITVLILTSPIPSHPSTDILDETICSVEGCNKKRYRRDLCNKHYSQLMASQISNIAEYIRKDNPERFLSKIKKDECGCWVWVASLHINGYSQFSIGHKKINGHVWSYIFFKGEIPEGMEVHHLCYNRACVNPDHLKLLTPIENIYDSPNFGANKTHCKNGHEFTEENTYLRPKGDGRDCKTCRAIANKKRYKK